MASTPACPFLSSRPASDMPIRASPEVYAHVIQKLTPRGRGNVGEKFQDRSSRWKDVIMADRKTVDVAQPPHAVPLTPASVPSAVATTGQDVCVVTVDDVRAVLAGLPRSSEVLVRDRVKFRVGQIVYVAFSQDETEIGFAFPKEERAALVAARPDAFFLPGESELRFHWIEAWLDALDADEMRELVLDAWRLVVPQRVAREVLGPPAAGHEPGVTG
jgi:hypothetical protein